MGHIFNKWDKNTQQGSRDTDWSQDTRRCMGHKYSTRLTHILPDQGHRLVLGHRGCMGHKCSTVKDIMGWDTDVQQQVTQLPRNVEMVVS